MPDARHLQSGKHRQTLHSYKQGIQAAKHGVILKTLARQPELVEGEAALLLAPLAAGYRIATGFCCWLLLADLCA
jgi:hypothetical protein